MAGDIWRPVQAGERLRIPASIFNEWLKQGRGLETGFGAEAGSFTRGPTIRVRNATGAALGELAIVGLGVPVLPTANLDQFKREVIFDGVLPAAAQIGRGHFAVVLDPLPDTWIGEAVITGVTPVRLTGFFAGGEACDPIVGDLTRLRLTATGNARVLWAETGSDERWAIVRLGVGPPAKLFGKLDTQLDYGGTATMSVWSADDTGENVTVHDWFLLPGQFVTAGKNVSASWQGMAGRYILDATQCEEL